MHISLKSLLRTPEGYLFDNQSLKALIVPLVIEQILSIAVGAADTMMVSSAGEAAVSAVSLVDNVFVLLINLFAALATGGAGHQRPVSRSQAAGCRTESSRAADPVHRRFLCSDYGADVFLPLLYPECRIRKNRGRRDERLYDLSDDRGCFDPVYCAV